MTVDEIKALARLMASVLKDGFRRAWNYLKALGYDALKSMDMLHGV
jgi:hypothetical protein